MVCKEQHGLVYSGEGARESGVIRAIGGFRGSRKNSTFSTDCQKIENSNTDSVLSMDYKITNHANRH